MMHYTNKLIKHPHQSKFTLIFFEKKLKQNLLSAMQSSEKYQNLAKKNS